MGSFDQDSSFLLATHDDTRIFNHDLNPIMEHNSSHLSHDDDNYLRVPPSQAHTISSEFDKLETCLAQEN